MRLFHISDGGWRIGPGLYFAVGAGDFVIDWGEHRYPVSTDQRIVSQKAGLSEIVDNLQTELSKQKTEIAKQKCGY